MLPPLPSPTSSSDQSISSYAQSSRRKTRVSAEHTLNRVRENQRRHRARQRDRVAFLEQQLADTEMQLADARREIEVLKAQQEATSLICRNEQSILTEDVVPPCDVHEERLMEEVVEMEMEIDPYLDSTTFSHTDGSDEFVLPSFSNSTPPGPPPCCSDPIPIPSPSPECSTCALQPPPSPTESTTLCSQAFILINQQNVRNLDPELIRGWLRKGLRSAGREGEGCRVENGALLGVLDMLGGF